MSDGNARDEDLVAMTGIPGQSYYASGIASTPSLIYVADASGALMVKRDHAPTLLAAGCQWAQPQ